jgi:Ca2+-transporting ATPase
MEKLADRALHPMPLAETTALLDLNLANGLSEDGVHGRRARFGQNRVSTRRGTSAWLKFLQQVNQPLIYILLIAVVVTSSLGEWVDASVILMVVLVNAIVGFLQESKAEKSIEALGRRGEHAIPE